LEHIKIHLKEIGRDAWTGFISLSIWRFERSCEHAMNHVLPHTAKLVKMYFY
jgi:hypothetical protein